MIGFVVRRIVAGLSVIAAVSILTFILFYAGPTDPARSICGDRNCVPERLEAIQKSLHLNDPIPVQMAWYSFGGFFAERLPRHTESNAHHHLGHEFWVGVHDGVGVDLQLQDVGAVSLDDVLGEVLRGLPGLTRVQVSQSAVHVPSWA